MSSARILVIEHEPDCGPGGVGAVLRAAGARLTVVGPHTGRELPRDLTGFDALLVLGGSPGPLDDDTAPWLPATRALVAEALADELPLLGICLGAQILAVAAGGTVTEAEHPEVGLSGFALTEAAAEDPLLGGLDRPLDALQWHFLEATTLPPGSASLARSERCANQAFRVGPCAWGLQFHLEADAATAGEWASAPESAEQLDRLGIDADRLVAEMADAEARLRSDWAVVPRRWLRVIDARRGALTA